MYKNYFTATTGIIFTVLGICSAIIFCVLFVTTVTDLAYRMVAVFLSLISVSNLGARLSLASIRA